MFENIGKKRPDTLLRKEKKKGGLTWITRHPNEEKPENQRTSADVVNPDEQRIDAYPGMVGSDFEIIKNEWEKLDELVEASEKEAVVFVGAVTQEKRTNTGARIYSDLFEKKYGSRDDVTLITDKEIAEIIDSSKKTPNPLLSIMRSLRKIISENGGKKVIISYPYLLTEIGLRPDFYDKKIGEPTLLSKTLKELTNNDPNAGALLWFEENGETLARENPSLEFSKPTEVAIRQIGGIINFLKLTRAIAPNRQIVRTIFGHGWNLDALAIYLANGNVSTEGFEEILGKEIFKNAKGFNLSFERDGAIKMFCRGKEYVIPVERLSEGN